MSTLAENNETHFHLSAAAPAGDSLTAWDVAISAGSQSFKTFSGIGPPPLSVAWDGRDDGGSLPGVDTVFDYTLTVTTELGLQATTAPQSVSVDVAAPVTPTITYPLSPTTQVRAVTPISGTAGEAGAVVVVWLRRPTGQVIRAGATTVQPDLTWHIPTIVLDNGQNTLWATVTDAADQDSSPSDPVAVTVEILPPLESVSRSPFPVGLDQELRFEATARGVRPATGQGPTVYVGATLYTQNGAETLSFRSSNPDATTSAWSVTRTVGIDLGDAEYDVPVTGIDADGHSNTSYIGVRIDVTAPGTPVFIAPRLNQPVDQTPYPLKGRAEPGSRVTIDVDGTQYTTLAGNNEGLWEVAVDLTTAGGVNTIKLRAADEAGNTSPWSDPLILTLDQAPPTLTASSLNPPWQQVSQSVALTATVSDDAPLYLGDVWAEVSGPQSALLHLLPGSTPSAPWENSFTGGVEGVYDVTINAKDRAGNIATDYHTLIVDSTLPTLTLSLDTAGTYGHIITQTVYYGAGSGWFTVTAQMTDTLAKLNTITFPTTTSAGQTYPLAGVDFSASSHTYDFAGGNNQSGLFDVTAADRAGNETSQTFNLVNDETDPTVTIDVPPTSGLAVPVSWSGMDDAAGVRSYEVEYRAGDTGPWTPWLADVSYTEATFMGTKGLSYTFQVKATDNVNNESGWVESGSVEVNAVTKYYTFGGQRVAMRQGDGVYYLSGDHLGSTSLTTDKDGNKVSEVRYLPYGQERWRNGNSVTDFGFTSQRNESAFGLMDYNARYYNPTIGRFVSPDSIVPEPGSSGGFNRYRYTRNNPLKYVDPSGHCPPSVCQGANMDPYYLSANVAEWQSTDVGVSYNDYVVGQAQYGQYTANPNLYLQDSLTEVGVIPGNSAAAGRRTMYAQSYAAAVDEHIDHLLPADAAIPTINQARASGNGWNLAAAALLFAGVLGADEPPGGGATCGNCGTNRPNLARSTGSLRIDPDGASTYCEVCLKNGQTDATRGNSFWIKSFDDYEAAAQGAGIRSPYYSPEPPNGPGHFSVFQGGPTDKTSDQWKELNRFIRDDYIEKFPYR